MAIDFSNDTDIIDIVVPGQTQVITVEVPGMQGPPGAIALGNVSTGAAGSDAVVAVRNIGDGTQVVDFTIPRGSTGPTNSITIGTVTTGAAAATLTGTAPAQVLNLTIPQGIQGIQGNTGASGTITSATASGLAAGATPTVTLGGTASARTFAFGIPAGATGPANTLTIGTVTTGAPGSSATAAITGTAPTQTLNLTIPQGAQGPQGAGSPDATTTAKGSVMLAGDLAGTAAAPTVPGLTNRTRKYTFDPGSPGPSGRQYIRIATLDGESEFRGSNLNFILSGTGDFGGLNRGTIIVHFAQRGPDVIQVKAFGFDVENTTDPIEFYTKKISTYKYELWAKLSDWNLGHDLHVLSSSDPIGSIYVNINLDSGTVAPTGLSATPYAVNNVAYKEYVDAVGSTGVTANSIMRRNATSDSSLRFMYMTGTGSTDPTVATRKDYVDALGTDQATANTVVRRGAAGAALFSAVGLSLAPFGASDATRKDYVDTQVATRAFTSHTHTAANINDSTSVGRSVLTAVDAAAARTAIGAGTGSSNLTIGTTGTTAAAGNDSRLSDARTPLAHTHGVADLTATGTRDSTTYLRGDNTWATITQGSSTVTASQITDATVIGRTVLTSADAAAVRTAIGAGTGTSNLVIGTTAGTAAAGNDSRLSDARTPTAHTHTAANISDSTTIGRTVLTAVDAAAVRTAIGAGTGTSNLVIGTTSTTAKAGDYAPPAATTGATGLVQLANHLGGTATAPTVRSATTALTGIVQLSTTAEATTGTDATKAVTPAGLKTVADTKANTTDIGNANADFVATFRSGLR